MNNVNVPVIPRYITVHLGAPDTPAQNVTVPFAEYIKNVASSELYPTWPESALRANILAQISFALNRIYTEYYRSQGYDFDITNTTGLDQSFVYGRDIFENINNIVDEIFTDYISRQGAVEPLFAQYCDGVNVQCSGLSQWGSVALANQGRTPYEILQNYYGENIDIVEDAEIAGVAESFRRPLFIGTVGNDVQSLQVRLNRISKNYPSIPKIENVNGVFDNNTANAVETFQAIFSLTPDGVVGRATWYRIEQIYNAVKRLSDLNSEGIPLSDVTNLFATALREGDRGDGVRELQYFLNFLSEFLPQVNPIAIDAIFGPETRAAVEGFQEEYGLPVTGEVDTDTWERIYRAYIGMLAALPEGYFSSLTAPYGGVSLRIGSEGENVINLQQYLNYISDTYTEIPKVTVDGVFGEQTAAAVRAYQERFGIPPTGIVAIRTYSSITETYRALKEGAEGSFGQFGGELG